METKFCGRCKQEKPVSEFYKHNRDGYRSRCKPCHLKDNYEYKEKNNYYFTHVKQYHQRPGVREHHNRVTREYFKRPEVRIKNLARWYVARLRRAGEVEREPCAFCGEEQVEAHHKDYTQPLLIVWLCSKCHRAEHNKISAKGDESGS